MAGSMQKIREQRFYFSLGTQPRKRRPTFSLLFFSALWTHLHLYAQKCTSLMLQAFLNPIKRTIKIGHHVWILNLPSLSYMGVSQMAQTWMMVEIVHLFNFHLSLSLPYGIIISLQLIFIFMMITKFIMSMSAYYYLTINIYNHWAFMMMSYLLITKPLQVETVFPFENEN